LNTYITNNEALKAYKSGRMGIVLMAFGFYFSACEMEINFRKKKSNKRAMWRVYAMSLHLVLLLMLQSDLIKDHW
jgi:hypothetical protein